MKKFYVYLIGQVQGPYSPDEIKDLPGFNRGTMVYPEDLANGTPEDWVPAFKVAEFGSIPFTSLNPPSVTPSAATVSPQSARTVGQGVFSDAERVKIMEHIRNLEKELEKAKNQNREMENLKLQLREKDERIFELSQEVKKLKPGSSHDLKSAEPVAEPEPVKKEGRSGANFDDYTQMDIPVAKILLIAFGISFMGVAVWMLMPTSSLNQFFRNLWVKKWSMSESRSADVVLSTQSAPHQKQAPPRKAQQAKISKPLSEKEIAEQEILQQYRRKVTAHEKVAEYNSKGVVADGSDFKTYMEVQSASEMESKRYKVLVNDYKDIYGEETWSEFVKRARQSSKKENIEPAQ